MPIDSVDLSDPLSFLSRLTRAGSGQSSASTLQRIAQELQKVVEALQELKQDAMDALAARLMDPGQGTDPDALSPVSGASGVGTPGPGGTPGLDAKATAPSTAANDASAPGPTSSAGPGQGTADLVRNAGGVLQAKPIDGVSPASKQVVDVGGGTDKVFNYTNATNREQSVTYSDREGRKATLTLQPGETGSFRGPSNAVGVRLSPSDASGNTHPNEVLDEDGATIAPGADANATQPATLKTQNQDISKVDGQVDFSGKPVNMTVVLSDGRAAGDGNAIHAYGYSTDDAASMGLAGDPSLTANVVISDKTT